MKEDFEVVQYRIETEGFDYCFNGYSSWGDIEDIKFHELRENYLKAMKELNDYVNKNCE